MANLDRIINAQISLNTTGISSAGFSTLMIVGPHANSLSRVLTITDVDELMDMGFTSTDAIYQAASDAFAQTPRPSVVKIGRFQCDTVKVKMPMAVVEGAEYGVSVQRLDGNGNLIEIKAIYIAQSSDTVDKVMTELSNKIDELDTAPKFYAASVMEDELVVKSTDPKTSFVVIPNGKLEVSSQEPATNIDVSSNMAMICDADNDFYGICYVDRTEDAVLAMAEWTEAHIKLYGVTVTAPGAKNAEITNDIGSKLQAANYYRTHWWYHEKDNEYPEAGIAARCFAIDPGGETWANKKLSSITVDNLNETEYNAIKAKNGNTFEKFRNVTITQNGKVAAGEWIDVIQFRDWLVETIQTEEFSMLINRDKLPFLDSGIGLVESTLNAVLVLGQKRGGIAENELDDDNNVILGFKISVPKAANISANVKAQRVLRDVQFTARLAGAIHAMEIKGSLTYENIKSA